MTARGRRTLRALALLGGAALAWAGRDLFTIALDRLDLAMHGKYTVEQRLAQFGADARTRLEPYFTAAGLPFPPRELAFLAFKQERRLEVFARSADGPWRHVRDYPIQGASGRAGPKLREGDRQVPEGLYRVVLLNPNSRFHVSLQLDYPNAWDRKMGLRDGRGDLGSDIMIHGKSASVGCLAMGDAAAEDLFTLAALTGPERVKVWIGPWDWRGQPRTGLPEDAPAWTAGLYEELRKELAGFAKPGG
ncbi:L,D-transpeptidase family protein [Methylomagnum ishizawai]|uniref:L,D-transpeptidase family protein n=1 Tax=Methylomagnum ishizawai TaxID=1760988 RepID=UPI001C32B563|nr:L,D-transpeptidase family protein [Methylomagnum ishizawai]BBL74965.1 lipoprotein [Methylomagnum ishizawai]